MRFKDELKERQGGCYAHHHPVDGNKERPPDQAITTMFHATDKMGVGIEEVAKDEAEYTHIEDRRWEQCMIQIDWAEQDVNCQ